MMSSAREPLRLSADELYSPKVEAYLEEQAVLQQRNVPEVAPRPWFVRIFYSSYLYLALAGGLGGLLAWACIEPFFFDPELGPGGVRIDRTHPVIEFLFLPIILGFIGLFLGAADGIMSRNFPRALICGAVGLGVGFGGGIATTFAANFIMNLMVIAGISVIRPQKEEITGLVLLVLMMSRGAAWVVGVIPAGLGQGIALRERKVLINGLLGAVLGGLVGGLLFDPIEQWLKSPDGQADVSRAVGCTVVGLFIGFFIGIVEQWTKTAWVLMKAGPLAGKQFIIYRNPTVLGSSPKADIYLFKDPAIEPNHALIHNRGGRFEIEDQNSADGTYVNGLPVQKQILKAGDQIVLGKTVLEFSLRDAR